MFTGIVGNDVETGDTVLNVLAVSMLRMVMMSRALKETMTVPEIGDAAVFAKALSGIISLFLKRARDTCEFVKTL